MNPAPRMASSSLAPSIRPKKSLNSRRRQFSSTTRWQRSATPRLDISKIAPKQKSLQARLKNVRRGQVPEDFGILPGTFVRPSWKEMDVTCKTTREKMKMQWLHIKQSARDFIALYWSYRWPTREASGKRPTAPMEKRERMAIARRLHETLYSAIANGDKPTLSKIALKGLAQQQASRIDRRALAELPTESWSVKYPGSLPPSWLPWPLQFLWPMKPVRILTDRQVNLPFGDKFVCRQVIARVNSTQTRDKQDGTSAPVTKTMTEYLVMQRMIIDGKAENWKVWGTTQPSTLADAMEIEALTQTNSSSIGNTMSEKISGMSGMS